MFEDSVDAAIAASLSLILEVSGNPKAGNVDREHNFHDLRYEHFIASAVGAVPAFITVARNKKIGDGILNAVRESMRWHKAGNVHFGAFLLLVPLIAAWDYGRKEDVAMGAVTLLKKSDYRDSLKVLEAFRMCKARVVKAERYDLQDEKTENEIKDKRMNLYDWMKIAPDDNLVAKELVEGYRISLFGAEILLNMNADTNESIVTLYHTLLSLYPDPLIIAKKGRKYAEKVVEWAKEVVECMDIKKIRMLDEKLIMDKANPGTIADLTVSSIYLALHEGWKI